MKVQLWLEKLSQSISLEAESTYQKGDLFCVKLKDLDMVYKYPIEHIFCITESGFLHSHREEK